MIEFDVDMSYLLECNELDKVILNDESGEHEPMEFVPKYAATVGAGTLTAEQVRECAKEVYFEGYGDGATHRVNGIEETDWQTIADKLNAMLGAWTCKDLGGIGANGEQVFHCSECGCVMSLYDKDGSNNLCTSFVHDCPRFCPECGRKVIESKGETE